MGGENLSPSEIEECLIDHPSVLEAAVIGIPDPRLDEVPVAFVKKVAGAFVPPEELIKFVASRLAKFKVPKHLFCVGGVSAYRSDAANSKERSTRVGYAAYFGIRFENQIHQFRNAMSITSIKIQKAEKIYRSFGRKQCSHSEGSILGDRG